MGAHTLGDANPGASGYRGPWVAGQTTDFNNVYYKLLTGDGVVFRNEVRLLFILNRVSFFLGICLYMQAVDKRDSDNDGDKKWQWQMEDTDGRRKGMMLNTDIELYYDIDVNAYEGTTCSATDGLSACTKADTANLVGLYASV